jgi:TolB protein
MMLTFQPQHDLPSHSMKAAFKARLFIAIGLLILSLTSIGCDEMMSKDQRNLSFATSPVKDEVVFTGNEPGNDLFTLNTGTQRVGLIKVGVPGPGQPAFSPDGKLLAFCSTDTWYVHLFVCHSDGTHARQLTFGTEHADMRRSFSPDGRQIVFARAARLRDYSFGGKIWDKWDIYTINVDGTGLRRLTHKESLSGSPSWSGDRKNIIYQEQEVQPDYSTRSNIQEVSADGSEHYKTLTADGHSYQPSLSVDCRKVVFISDRATPYAFDIYTMNVDGTHVVRLTHENWYTTGPQFTHDGSRVLFLGDTGSRSPARNELWEVKTDGTDLRRVADSTLFDDPLKWHPGP